MDSENALIEKRLDKVNMSDTKTPALIYVKYENKDGALEIARHIRPSLLSPDENLDDYIRDIVHSYKSNTNLVYLGLADEDEYEAFQKLHISTEAAI